VRKPDEMMKAQDHAGVPIAIGSRVLLADRVVREPDLSHAGVVTQIENAAAVFVRWGPEDGYEEAAGDLEVVGR